MKNGISGKYYKMLVNCDATILPFESEQFDCVVSSDFIGHIPMEKKERLFSEMSRVLKRGGLSAHIIETDSDTFINKFTKKYPDLYQRYFIEGSGGHFGLEPPTVVLERFRSVGLMPLQVGTYFSYIRDIESFIALFDNEYKEKSVTLNNVLGFYKLLCRNFTIKIIATILMGGVSYLIDIITPINKAEGILVIAVKKD
jgi:ubiquinone/menaquinone biosynthesis C-methylase UbiE